MDTVSLTPVVEQAAMRGGCGSVCVRVRLGAGRRRVAYALTSLQNLLYALVAAVFFGSGSTELMAIMLDFML